MIYRIIVVLALVFFTSAFSDMHVVTYATKNKPELKNLQKSALKNGLSLTVLGMDTIFKSHADVLRGYINYLNYADLDEEDIVVFVDAYDILFLQSKRIIFEKFKEMNADIVFAAEKHCWPDDEMKAYYPKAPTKHRYLNAGGMIGTVKALKKLAANVQIPDGNGDDQRILTDWFLFKQDSKRVKLDYHCKIFLCLERVHDKDLDIHFNEKLVRYIPTDTYPCIIHGNGNGKNQYELLSNFYK